MGETRSQPRLCSRDNGEEEQGNVENLIFFIYMYSFEKGSTITAIKIMDNSIFKQDYSETGICPNSPDFRKYLANIVFLNISTLTTPAIFIVDGFNVKGVTFIVDIVQVELDGQ